MSSELSKDRREELAFNKPLYLVFWGIEGTVGPVFFPAVGLD